MTHYVNEDRLDANQQFEISGIWPDPKQPRWLQSMHE